MLWEEHHPHYPPARAAIVHHRGLDVKYLWLLRTPRNKVEREVGKVCADLAAAHQTIATQGEREKQLLAEVCMAVLPLVCACLLWGVCISVLWGVGMNVSSFVWLYVRTYGWRSALYCCDVLPQPL